MAIFLEFWIAIMAGILIGWLLTHTTATRKQISPEETKLLKDNQRLAEKCVAMSKLKSQIQERHDNKLAAAKQTAKQRTQQNMNLEYGKFRNTAQATCASLKRNEHAKLEKIEHTCQVTLEKVKKMQNQGQNVRTIINLLIEKFPKIKEYLVNPKQFLHDRQKKAAEAYARTLRVMPRWDRFICWVTAEVKLIARWENMSFRISNRSKKVGKIALDMAIFRRPKNQMRLFFDEWFFQHMKEKVENMAQE